jgi:hypothetical protein
MTQFSSICLTIALSSLGLAACSGGGVCERALEKEIECSDDPAKAKARIASSRSEAIAFCNDNKDNPQVKAAIECSKEKTCEAFRTCNLAARSAEDVKEIEDLMAANKPIEAMQECSYQLDSYKSIAAMKTVCEKAITASFADLSKDEDRSDARFRCASSSQSKEWLEASEAMKAGCNKLMTEVKALVVTQRDSGAEFNYGNCADYKELVKAIDPANSVQAEALCKEAEKADDFKDAMVAAQESIQKNTKDIPFMCANFLKNKKDFADSEWFNTKAEELAKVCFSDLGKIVLADVSSYCGMDAENTHLYAAEYKLGEKDPELKQLLAKTASKCNKS